LVYFIALQTVGRSYGPESIPE